MFRAMLATMAMIGAGPAAAREWADVAGWSIVELEKGCALHNEFEGPGDTELMLILDRDDDGLLLSITNTNWSSVAKQVYPDIEYDTSTTTYSGGKAVGFENGGKKGFITRFEPDFAAAVAKSSYLHVRRGEVYIDKLSLSGSAAALARVRTCVAALRADKRRVDEAEAAEKRRYAGIARDPFATDSPSAGPATRALLRRGTVMNDDYPPAAVRAGEKGRSVATYTVGTDGRVTSCTASGAGPILDMETCRLIERRFRFDPAKDASGNAVAETKTQSVNWELPVVPEPIPVPAAVDRSGR